jgi:hypothetical protein
MASRIVHAVPSRVVVPAHQAAVVVQPARLPPASTHFMPAMTASKVASGPTGSKPAAGVATSFAAALKQNPGMLSPEHQAALYGATVANAQTAPGTTVLQPVGTGTGPAGGGGGGGSVTPDSTPTLQSSGPGAAPSPSNPSPSGGSALATVPAAPLAPSVGAGPLAFLSGRPKWQYWLAGGFLLFAGWYFFMKPASRKTNPFRKQNPASRARARVKRLRSK